MLKRALEKDLIQELKSQKIMLLIGARQTGKTTLLKMLKKHLDQINATTHYINLEDKSFLSELNKNPRNLFNIVPEGKTQTIFIDEIQYLDDPSNFLKLIYDEYTPKIKLIVSGSSAFYINQKFTDSLAGRKRIFYVSPFTFSEFLDAKKESKLSQKLRERPENWQKRKWLMPEAQTLKTHLNEYLRFGGYPDVILAPTEDKKINALKELHTSFLSKDFLEGKIEYEDKAYMLIKILAGNTGGLLNTQELANTLNLAHTTIQHYLYILRKSFILQLCRPFHKNLRKELSKMPKAYFLDLGMRNIALGNFEPIETRLDKGAHLENATFIALNTFQREKIKFWRTQSKNEVDFIINEEVALEVKFSISLFKESKTKKFRSSYPEIPLYPITHNDPIHLNLLDILG